MFAFVQQVFHHLGIVEGIFFKGLPILVMGSLNSLLEYGVEKQIVSIDHASGRLLVMVW